MAGTKINVLGSCKCGTCKGLMEFENDNCHGITKGLRDSTRKAIMRKFESKDGQAEFVGGA